MNEPNRTDSNESQDQDDKHGDWLDAEDDVDGVQGASSRDGKDGGGRDGRGALKQKVVSSTTAESHTHPKARRVTRIYRSTRGGSHKRHTEGKSELGEVRHDLYLHSKFDTDQLSRHIRGASTKHHVHGRSGSAHHSRRGESAQRSPDRRGGLLLGHPRMYGPAYGQSGSRGLLSAQQYGRARGGSRGGSAERYAQGWKGGYGRGAAVRNDDLNCEEFGRIPPSFGNHRGRVQNIRQRPKRNPGGTKYMTQEEIKRLACSNSEAVIRYITENEGGFLAAYSHQPNCSHPLRLKQLIKFLYLLVKSDNDELAARIIAQIFDGGVSIGTSVFCTNLESLIRKMSIETRQDIICENSQYLDHLIEIGTFAISAVPSSVMCTFPYPTIKDTIQIISPSGGDDEALLVKKAQTLADEFTEALKHNLRQQLPSNNVGCVDIDLPPQPFTELSVLPTTDEIHPHAPKPYLRPNITKGGYTDWEHYLDVQFRLMREDFVSPLRDGIRILEQKGTTDKYLSEVRIYEGVSFLNTECVRSGVGFTIQFDATRFQRVNWEHSKRLIFGSLLCFSRDNFRTIYFATVVKRDPELLNDGLVTVQFEGEYDENVFQIDPNERFVMVESTAYFEAYRHILEGIKRASQLHLTDKLQIFKKYLVHCRVETPLPMPRYLHFSDKTFHLKEVIGIKCGSPDVVVTDISSWPPHEHTDLDDSQLRAFRAALTQEVSVIQGPPGTGKTFIGLKVVEALVTNKKKFQPTNFPILVLCYTNHALDQFLEGIISIETQESKELNIIRIGGRCKTKCLENYVLKAKINHFREQRLLPSNLARESSDLYHEIQGCKDDIEYAQESVKLLEGRNKMILKLRVLEKYIQSHHLQQLRRGRPTQRGREVDVWLKLWYVHGEEEELPPKKEEKLPAKATKKTTNHPDDEYIQVDAQANLLEDERMLEGEELVLPRDANPDHVQTDLCVPDTFDHKPHHGKWKIKQISGVKRKRRIMDGHLNKPMTYHDAKTVTNIWQISLKRRWSLYLHWVDELIRDNKRLISNRVLMYNEACKERTKTLHEIDGYVIKTADIVGMTTTGAAKYNHILSKMIPKIVIIEEAAEVFEAHVFTSLTPSVQQLIMIGDHKQLRPKANCYNLEKKYEFCVSLFERLARNDFPVHTLEVQHRMRPEIASLIRPSIYEKLINDESVEKYDNVKGVGSNLFFIDHTFLEKANDDSDRSHSNLHEADYLAALCKYLLKQGYSPSEITVLTMYRGQLLELKKRMRKQDFYGVRVAAVDDFQGEENEIILLSLVRSNSDGNIGFLKIENRVCVSLSRAKIGFFVIGNLSMLRDEDESVWPQILADLSEKDCIGQELPLYCQLHPHIKVLASTAKDFLKCPEGGCQQKCAFRLNCGHTCPRLCHPIDQEHKHVRCIQKCPQILDCGHNCKYKCFRCVQGCPPCSEPVVKRIDLCGHEIEMPCHQDPSTFDCTRPCSKSLSCGHDCQELCSASCTKDCRIYVEKKLPCGHDNNIPCCLHVNTAECKHPCNATLDCRHKCPGKCGQCKRGRLHVRCRSTCGRTLVCSHVCNFPCTPTCPPCMEDCNNYCGHSKCPRICYQPCVPCREPCKWKCKHYQCSRLCSEMCDRPPCDEPCKEFLKCGHPCIGLCGEKCPTKCRVCDRDEVCEIFFGNEEDEDARFIQLEECGHVIEVTACDAWMEQEDDESKPSEVQFKCCPKCKTQIRKSLRYGKIVKLTLQDYENIKKQQLVHLSDDLVEKFQEVECEVQKVSSCLLTKLFEQLEYIKRVLNPSTHRKGENKVYLPPHVVNKFNTQLSYSTHIATMVKQLSSIRNMIITSVFESSIKLVGISSSIKNIQDDIKTLVEFLVQRFLSDQQISDIRSEIYRLRSLIKLLDLCCKLKVHGKYSSLTDEEKSDLASEVKRVRESGWKSDKLKEKDHDDIVQLVTKMSDKYKVDGLTDAERIEVVKAIGLTKGHWFKCPNGHYYCIGECGGAMEEAKCPDCGATIGGRQHTLRSDNQLAPEMDGAQHAAWSDMTNIANFDPDQFR